MKEKERQTEKRKKRAESKMSHTTGPVSEKRVNYLSRRVGGRGYWGRRGKKDLCWWGCVTMTHCVWHKQPSHIESVCFHFSPSSVFSLSFNLLLSLTGLAGDEVMPPRPVLLRLTNTPGQALLCYHWKPLTLEVEGCGQHTRYHP